MEPYPGLKRRWATISREAFHAALVALFIPVLALSACSASGGTPTPTRTPTPFKVSSVDLAVTPTSIADLTCGSHASFTYTATFHIPAGTAGGVIQLSYTLNNGRSQTDGSVTVGAGETSKTFAFTSSGVLSPDHTYPGPALVMVTSPNNLISSAAIPDGACVTAGPFTVTSVTMAVNPTSIAGIACGTQFTETYTATFNLAPHGAGGTIVFYYTINNGRGDNLAHLTVDPGQTTATYSFTWSGALPADHMFPEGGGVWVQTPNDVLSPLLAPTGQCS